MTLIIHTEDLKKTYTAGWRRPPKEALKGVSLSISEGETFGFVGPNGAGKSTLIKILVGVLKPTSGEARLFGRDVSRPEARKGLGFVPESPSLQNFLTPYEVLTMALRLHGVRVNNEKQHCMSWLERFDLGAVAHQPIRRFSKGMMQRTALAHAMVIAPRLLVLDEPLSGLDPVGRKDVVDILDEYRKSGGTLFFSSHVLYDVERIADRFGLIHQGRLLTIRSPQEIVAEQADRYDLTYRGGAVMEGGFEVRPGLFAVELKADELSAAIDRVRMSNGVIQDVHPKVSLESVFFRTISQSD